MINDFLNWFLNSTQGKQFKNAFDEVTKDKILKGAIWAFLDAGVAAVGAYFLNVQVDNQLLALSLAWFGPFIVNAWNEYRKGKKQYSVSR
jgi:hypothetical protein